jgi:hypothetical protein
MASGDSHWFDMGDGDGDGNGETRARSLGQKTGQSQNRPEHDLTWKVDKGSRNKRLPNATATRVVFCRMQLSACGGLVWYGTVRVLVRLQKLHILHSLTLTWRSPVVRRSQYNGPSRMDDWSTTTLPHPPHTGLSCATAAVLFCWFYHIGMPMSPLAGQSAGYIIVQRPLSLPLGTTTFPLDSPGAWILRD